MESDLLRKEDEFYKENEKLEQRTKQLMQKVNDVMKIQDNLIKDSLKTKSEISFAKYSSYKSKSEPLECFNSYDLNKNDEKQVPASVDDMGSKSASQFYRAKIKSLQAENIRLNSENRKKGEEVKKLQKENQNILDQKEKWFIAYNTAKNSIGKLESQLACINAKLQGKECEIVALKKELDLAKKELKSSNLNSNSFELRLNRAYEENEKLKASLKSAKEEEKELKESYRKQINDLTSSVKHVEKHKMELLNGFKKQLQLIDNLKKQKMYLETLKVAELSELEYLKMLDWKPE